MLLKTLSQGQRWGCSPSEMTPASFPAKGRLLRGCGY